MENLLAFPPASPSHLHGYGLMARAEKAWAQESAVQYLLHSSLQYTQTLQGN